MNLADQLRTIGARLCLREETQLDGRMILAAADQAMAIESELATISEQAEAIIAALNDPINGVAELVATLERIRTKRVREVDGTPVAAGGPNKPSDEAR